jgi:hypothetical protein
VVVVVVVVVVVAVELVVLDVCQLTTSFICTWGLR